LLRLVYFDEWVFMSDSLLASLAEVEVLADSALVPHSEDRASPAAVAGDVQVLDDNRSVDLLRDRILIANLAQLLALHELLEDCRSDLVQLLLDETLEGLPGRQAWLLLCALHLVFGRDFLFVGIMGVVAKQGVWLGLRLVNNFFLLLGNFLFLLEEKRLGLSFGSLFLRDLSLVRGFLLFLFLLGFLFGGEGLLGLDQELNGLVQVLGGHLVGREEVVVVRHVDVLVFAVEVLNGEVPVALWLEQAVVVELGSDLVFEAVEAGGDFSQDLGLGKGLDLYSDLLLGSDC